MRILVIEDDLMQCRQLESHIAGLGHRAESAVDVQSAWEAAQGNPPDAILLDLNIPGGTGLKFLNQRNGSNRLRAVPVIVITGVEDPMVRRMAEQHAVEIILSKPVDYRRLDAVLQKVSDRLAAK